MAISNCCHNLLPIHTRMFILYSGMSAYSSIHRKLITNSMLEVTALAQDVMLTLWSLHALYGLPSWNGFSIILCLYEVPLVYTHTISQHVGTNAGSVTYNKNLYV